MGRRDFELLAKGGGLLRELLGAEARNAAERSLRALSRPQSTVFAWGVSPSSGWLAPRGFLPLSKYLPLACDLGCEGQEFPSYWLQSRDLKILIKPAVMVPFSPCRRTWASPHPHCQGRGVT